MTSAEDITIDGLRKQANLLALDNQRLEFRLKCAETLLSRADGCMRNVLIEVDQAGDVGDVTLEMMRKWRRSRERFDAGGDGEEDR